MVSKKLENKFCPYCGKKTLRFIEDCEADNDTRKTSWTCDCSEATVKGTIIYIYEFAEPMTAPSLKPIEGEIGDHMTVEQFSSMCISGSIIETDGVGFYANRTHVSTVSADPRDVRHFGPLEGWTHVMWYNK